MVLLWTVLLSVTVYVSSQPSPLEKPKGFFWQLTDVHWDREYSPSGDPKKMCHEKRGQVGSDKGDFGSYSCDSPWQLVESTIAAMADRQRDPDFIVWTGDNSPHVKDPVPDWDYVFSSLKKVTRLLRDQFPNSQVIPVLGNHDIYPEDFYPGKTGGIYEAYLKEGGWQELLSHKAKGSFSACGFYATMPTKDLKVLVLNTNLYNVPDNLTNNIEDPCGQFMWMDRELKKAELAGTKVLVAAHIPPGYFERYVETPFYNAHHNKRYINLLNQFGHVIVGHLYGHTHTDSFRLFRNSEEDEVKSVAFIAPSVTPWLHSGGVNPSVRLYSYHPQESHITDYWQYYLNLTEVNREQTNEKTASQHLTSNDAPRDVDRSNEQTPNQQFAVIGKDGNSLLDERNHMYRPWASRPANEIKTYLDNLEGNDMEIVDREVYRRKLLGDVIKMKKEKLRAKRSLRSQPVADPGWKLLYQATNFFAVDDLKTENMLAVYDRLAANSSFFDKFYAYNTGGHVFEPCDETCKRKHICAIGHLHNSEMQNCLLGRPVLSLAEPGGNPPKDKVAETAQRAIEMDKKYLSNSASSPSSDPERDFTAVIVSAGVLVFFVIAIAMFIFRKKDNSGFSYYTMHKSHRHSYEPIQGDIL